MLSLSISLAAALVTQTYQMGAPGVVGSVHAGQVVGGQTLTPQAAAGINSQFRRYVPPPAFDPDRHVDLEAKVYYGALGSTYVPSQHPVRLLGEPNGRSYTPYIGRPIPPPPGRYNNATAPRSLRQARGYPPK